MQLEVFDVLGSSVCSLDDDSATLDSLPIADGMKLHVSIQTIYKLPTCAPSAWLRVCVCACFVLAESTEHDAQCVDDGLDLLRSHLLIAVNGRHLFLLLQHPTPTVPTPLLYPHPTPTVPYTTSVPISYTHRVYTGCVVCYVYR